MQGETLEAIATALIQFLVSVGLDFSRCTGIGTDGCSVMVWKNNSVYTPLLKRNQQLTLIKCVCHSNQLCASKAVDTLPCNLKYLVSHSHHWFSHNSLRQHEYVNIYQVINHNNMPLKLVQLSATRWLTIHDSCVCIRDQWDELKLHFQLSRDTSDTGHLPHSIATL